MKILVIRLGAVGDVIRTVPAVMYLKKRIPNTIIHWIVEDRASNLLLNHPKIEKLHIIPRKKYYKVINILKNIRKEQYDYVLDFHGLLKSGLISFFSGVKKRIGYQKSNSKEFNWIFNNIKAPKISNKVTRIEKNFNLLKALIDNVEIPDKLETFFYIEKEKIEFIDNFYQKLHQYKYFIGINPCTSKAGKYKEWPIEYYSKLIDVLDKYFSGKACFIITWGPGEFEKVKSLEKSKNTLIAPPTDMKELMELIKRLDVFITGDTGPMHLASTLNIPILAIFGPSDVDINKPWGEKNIVSYVNVGCNPCRNKNCIDLKCQWELKPEKVFNDFKLLISRINSFS